MVSNLKEEKMKRRVCISLMLLALCSVVLNSCDTNKVSKVTDEFLRPQLLRHLHNYRLKHRYIHGKWTNRMEIQNAGGQLCIWPGYCGDN